MCTADYDDPRVWLLHCHIGCHVSEELSTSLCKYVRKDDIKLDPTVGKSTEDGCAAWNNYLSSPNGTIYAKFGSGVEFSVIYPMLLAIDEHSDWRASNLSKIIKLNQVISSIMFKEHSLYSPPDSRLKWLCPGRLYVRSYILHNLRKVVLRDVS